MEDQKTALQGTWVRVCLVSTPGPICDATCATLIHAAHVKLIAIASGALSATQMLRHLQPDLVLLDANLPEEEVLAFLQWLNDNYPAVQRLVATVTSAQAYQALAFGAAAAVRREDLATCLGALVGDLLDHSDNASNSIQGCEHPNPGSKRAAG
jgi:DNA-binding NarL/FixJ family response regulator